MTAKPESAHIRIHLMPHAGHDAIDGWRDGALYVRVSARPVDGKANEALIQLLAKAWGLPRSRLQITRGERSRLKTVVVTGFSQFEVDVKLERDSEAERASPPSAC